MGSRVDEPPTAGLKHANQFALLLDVFLQVFTPEGAFLQSIGLIFL
jgi:hypothetical protein